MHEEILCHTFVGLSHEDGDKDVQKNFKQETLYKQLTQGIPQTAALLHSRSDVCFFYLYSRSVFIRQNRLHRIQSVHKELDFVLQNKTIKAHQLKEALQSTKALRATGTKITDNMIINTDKLHKQEEQNQMIRQSQ